MSSEILRRHWLSEWSTIGRRGKPFWMASWYTKLRMAGGALVTGKRTSTFLLQWVIGSPKCAGILGRVCANKFTGVVHCSTFSTPPAQPNKYPYNNRIRFEIENNRGIHWIDNTVVVYLLKVVLHQCLIDVGARIYIYWFESHCPWGMRSPTSRMVCAVSSARISCPSKSFIQPLRMCSHSHSQGGTVLIVIVIVIVPPPLNLSGRQRV